VPLRHESLAVWQRADDLFIELHAVARQRFPPEERFELSSQLRRAAYSVVANIVEGVARRSSRERAHFLNISEGSLSEVRYCLHAARRLGYLNTAEHERLSERVNMVGAPLAGLLRSVRAAESQNIRG